MARKMLVGLSVLAIKFICDPLSMGKYVRESTSKVD